MEIISRFIDLCLFRASPSDVPASAWLLKITLLSYFVLSLIVNKLDNTWNTSFFVSLADIAVMVIIVGLLLTFRGFQSRYTQVIIALAGAGCCMAIIGFPIIWWFFQIEPEQQTASFALLMMVVLLIWSLMVMAQIFRHSLEVKSATAMLITIAYIMITLVVTGLVMSGVV
ncbi:MAG: hypothetical protein COA83_11930 [Methylophaga sp.]|nr:MAG: hypothetical protein COA83_11930 [Methylophaga sp.]